VAYLLSIPAIPWSLGKALLRQAMIGVLPDAIRCRKKTPLAGDLGSARAAAFGKPRSPLDLTCVSGLDRYVDTVWYPDLPGGDRAGSDFWTDARAINLAFWLDWNRGRIEWEPRPALN